MSMELAAEAMTILVPFLTGAGEGAAKLVGEKTFAGVGKLVEWVRTHLPAHSTALVELEAEPGSTLNQDDLRTQLAKLLDKNPDLVPELRALLPSARAEVATLSQTVGSGVGVQTVGHGNTTTVHKG